MKIGEFSARFDVSYDTIRYYMSLNLLIPEKRGGQYHFDAACVREMEEILRLKEMDFSLVEIKKILSFQRMGKLTPYQQSSYYQSLYREKVREIDAKLGWLVQAKEELEAEITKLGAQDLANPVTLGVDLALLSLFCCPRCQRDLLLTAERVAANQVIEGALYCECGESFMIREGILYAEPLQPTAELVEENHVEKYLESTHPDFIDLSYQSLDWMQRQFEGESLAGKVILEPGSGYGHFLRQIYERLPADAVYICVDHHPQMHRYLQQLLAMTGKRAKVLFVAASLPDLPLREGVVDLVVDFTGTSCFAFEQAGFLPALLDRYMQREAAWMGTFIVYQKFGPHTVVAEPHRSSFREQVIREGLCKLGFAPECEYRQEPHTVLESMGQYESFAQQGDQIYAYQINAKRWS